MKQFLHFMSNQRSKACRASSSTLFRLGTREVLTGCFVRLARPRNSGRSIVPPGRRNLDR